MKARVFREETFSFNVHLLVPCSEEQFTAYVKKITGQDYAPGDCHGVCFSTADDVMVGLTDWKRTPGDIGTLSHELCHAAWHVLRLREVKLCDDVEEVFCYLQESLLRRCLERL